ncbi:MAG: hypothetical protein JWR51_2921 [Devosia sp.]|nr:hypothetical protein [Devosia sp.]
MATCQRGLNVRKIRREPGAGEPAIRQPTMAENVNEVIYAFCGEVKAFAKTGRGGHATGRNIASCLEPPMR